MATRMHLILFCIFASTVSLAATHPGRKPADTVDTELVAQTGTDKPDQASQSKAPATAVTELETISDLDPNKIVEAGLEECKTDEVDQKNEPNVVKFAFAPSESDIALKKMMGIIKSKFENGVCRPQESILVLDVDGTVLEVSSGKARGIRDSAKIVKEAQTLGMITLALTARDAILVKYRPWLSKNFKHPSAKTYFYHQFSLVKGDLSDSGVNFGVTAPKLGDHSVFLKEDGRATDQGFFRLGTDEPFGSSDLGDLLFYGDGLVMASHHPKGEVLKEFLKRKQLTGRMRCIFFADDEVDNIESMATTYATSDKTNLYTFYVPVPDEEDDDISAPSSSSSASSVH